MMEVCFSDATHAVLFDAKAQTPEKSFAKEILALPLELPFGDIATALSSECARKDYINKWLNADPWGDFEQDADIDTFWSSSISSLARLKSALKRGEDIRLWVDHSPSAICGKYFVANLAQESGSDIYIVTIPEDFISTNKGALSNRAFFDFCEDDIIELLTQASKIADSSLFYMAEHWSKLVAENAPLRVVQGDKLVSVPIDYYDEIIVASVPKKETLIGVVIGDILDDEQMYLLGDYFIAERIRHLISVGKLKVTSEKEAPFYASTIK